MRRACIRACVRACVRTCVRVCAVRRPAEGAERTVPLAMLIGSGLHAAPALQIEAEIVELEGSYLEDTATTGNILKGWDGYFHSGPQQRGGPRVVKIKNSDRVFSNSSATAPLKVRAPARQQLCIAVPWRVPGCAS